jgi:NADPH:quinone reductase-like Zn-dependent oxidoreductase
LWFTNQAREIELSDMKAVVLNQTGGVEVLRVSEVADPEIGANDCLVRIQYAGVNYADILSRQGLYTWAGKRPYILGLESSGIVEKVGPQVTRFKVGDAVVIGSKQGNYAELIAKNEADILPAPEGFSFEQLACLCGNWMTAWTALFELARVREAEIALIHSGAGGVGIAAIQLARACGLRVFATASSQTKQDYIGSLGAAPLSYENFDRHMVKENAPDFILESVGGAVHKRSLKILAPLGRLVSIGASAIKVNKWNPFSWYRAWLDYPRISRPELQSQAYMTLHIGFLLEDHKERIAPVWERMIAFMQEHHLRPLLQENAVYPMSKVGEVHQLIDSRKNIGRFLLDPRK